MPRMTPAFTPHVALPRRARARQHGPRACRADSEASVRMRARVAYDGARYSGWQLQPTLNTVQGEVEASLARRCGRTVRVVAASRTDKGVHARGQAVHFDVPPCVAAADAGALQFSLNQMLPADVRVQYVGRAPAVPWVREPGEEQHEGLRPWNAIYCSKGKRYTYRFTTAPVFDPMARFYRHYEWRAARYGFSEDTLRAAAHAFVGTHDFSAFTNTAQPPPGYVPAVLKNPVRTIRSVTVIAEGEGSYRIDFVIDGALYKMIRNVMGTILDVSCGKMEISRIQELFDSRDRRLTPKSAPAHGLCLEEVFYDDWEM